MRHCLHFAMPRELEAIGKQILNHARIVILRGLDLISKFHVAENDLCGRLPGAEAIILVAPWLEWRGSLRHVLNDEYLHDLGKFLLAFSVFRVYKRSHIKRELFLVSLHALRGIAHFASGVDSRAEGLKFCDAVSWFHRP